MSKDKMKSPRPRSRGCWPFSNKRRRSAPKKRSEKTEEIALEPTFSSFRRTNAILYDRITQLEEENSELKHRFAELKEKYDALLATSPAQVTPEKKIDAIDVIIVYRNCNENLSKSLQQEVEALCDGTASVTTIPYRQVESAKGGQFSEHQSGNPLAVFYLLELENRFIAQYHARDFQHVISLGRGVAGLLPIVCEGNSHIRIISPREDLVVLEDSCVAYNIRNKTLYMTDSVRKNILQFLQRVAQRERDTCKEDERKDSVIMITDV